MPWRSNATALADVTAPRIPMRITRDRGILRIESTDIPDAATCEWRFDEFARADKAEPILGILALSPATVMPDAAARNVIYRRRREVLRHRVAVVGTNAFQGFLVNFLATAIANRSVRHFFDEAAALAWLREPADGG